MENRQRDLGSDFQMIWLTSLKTALLRGAAGFVVIFFAAAAYGQAGSMGSQLDFSLLALNTFDGGYTDDQGVAEPNLVPSSLISLDKGIVNVVWVEMEQGRLHLMKRDPITQHWWTAFSRPISIGKAGIGKEYEGDNRTPVGVYRMTGFLPDRELIDFYGSGAFPLNYPNAWDRLHRRTGHGIWLHGLPKGIDERPLLDSEGCVVIDNPAFEWLMERIDPATSRVFLGHGLDLTSPQQLVATREELQAKLEGWRQAWAAMDDDLYLGHYAEDFSSGDRDLAQWIEYKTRIHAQKTWVEVGVSELSIYGYPGDIDLIVTEFYQVYESSNFNARGWKQLFWKREADGTWKIVFEGAA